MNYKDIVKTALNEVGYQGEKYRSKYSSFLDSIGWYNGIKSGECTWCAIFYDYLFAVNKGNLTYSQVRQIVCEPVKASENSGAGCIQKSNMYKGAGRWITNPSKASSGDQIFFKGSDGKIYHTGIVVDWDNSGFWVVEGSTTYNGNPHSVGKKHYAFSDSKIAGFGRPDWFKFDSDPEPEKKHVYVDISAPEGCEVIVNIDYHQEG